MPLLNFPYPSLNRKWLDEFPFSYPGPVDYLRTYATTTTGQRERQKSISQTTTWHVLHGLFFVVVVHFFAVIARPRHETGLLLKRGTRRAGNGKTKNGNKTSWTLALSVTSFPILCFVPIFSFSHFFIFPFPVLVTSHETVLISRFLDRRMWTSLIYLLVSVIYMPVWCYFNTLFFLLTSALPL